MESKKLVFACCFCYEDGVVEGDEPIEVVAAGQRDEREHVFYAHLECLRRALHPQIHLQVPFYEDERWTANADPAPDPSDLPDDEGPADPHQEPAGLRLVQSSGPVNRKPADS